MNERQLNDADECNRMAENGETKDCFGCSCNVCLLHTDYVSRTKVFQLIDKELEFASKVNPQTAMGITQIRNLITRKL